eukprot:51731-Eustigmatos_ZCMA.PRE.1
MTDATGVRGAWKALDVPGSMIVAQDTAARPIGAQHPVTVLRAQCPCASTWLRALGWRRFHHQRWNPPPCHSCYLLLSAVL